MKIDLIVMNFLDKSYPLKETKESKDVASQILVNLMEEFLIKNKKKKRKKRVDSKVTKRSERLKKLSFMLSFFEFYTYVRESFEK